MDHTTQSRHGAEPLRTVPMFPVLLGTCAVVVTAYVLGATWLTDPVLGVPLGIWFLPIAFALAHWGGQIRVERAGSGIAGLWRAMLANPPGSRFLGRLWRAVAAAGGAFAAAWNDQAFWIGPSPEDLEVASYHPGRARMGGVERADEHTDADSTESASSEPVRHIVHATPRRRGPARVGVSLSLPAARELLRGPATHGVEWIALVDQASERAAREHGYDAVLSTDHEGSVRLTLSDPAEDAWPDWRDELGAAYPAVFRARLEPQRVTLATPGDAIPIDPTLTRALIESAVLLHRSAGLDTGATGMSSQAWSAMTRLSDLLVRSAARSEFPASAIPAARVVSAWAATTTGSLDIHARLDAIEAAGRVLGEESGVQLRLAAARFGAAEDDAALSALRLAFEQLELRRRAQGDEALTIDQVPFVHSELEHAMANDPMAVGRIAAGMCLCAALTPASGVAYLGDDFADDLRYAPWLLGRDQDRALLLRVLRELESWCGASAAGGARAA